MSDTVVGKIEQLTTRPAVGASELKGVVRCEFTGNLCGTDTWCVGKPPNCRCGKIERLKDALRIVAKGRQPEDYGKDGACVYRLSELAIYTIENI